MAYTEFINGQAPYLSDTVLNNMQKGLMELVFPIGSTYITQTNLNPNTILGFGTWERLKGKVCVGLDENDTAFDTIGETGGEKTHTLTTDEMPSHRHHVRGEDLGDVDVTIGNDIWSWGGGVVPLNANNAGSHVYADYVGGGQSHNNLQPYKVVGYMWIRTN